jgi:sulfur carrier protein
MRSRENAMDGQIRINGRDEPLSVLTIARLVAEKTEQANPKGIAVALNGKVVPRQAWSDTTLQAGDQIEIVRVLQGG